MSYSIVGAGLAGAIVSSFLPQSTIYEKNKLGGLCADNKNYQDFIHVLHTNNDEVWNLITKYTSVRPHQTILKAYVNGKVKQHPPKSLSPSVVKYQIEGYSWKMWKRPIPTEALARITVSKDGLMFREKYQGIPDFTKLFENLTSNSKIVKKDVRDGDLKGTIILTGAIDEYFNYCYGKLPYRGMQSVHYKSETRLEADFITFSDEKIPFQRLVDYDRLGYEGGYIGVESACDEKHYPIRDEESIRLYEKYKKLADEKGIKLVGRLATYRYQNMDEVIEDALKLAKELK